MFCVKCGNKLDDTARFCPSCGSPVQLAGGSSDVVETSMPMEDLPIAGPNDERLALRYKENFKYCFLKRYVGFSGRASRNEYWKFSLVTTAVGAILYLVVSLLALLMDATGGFFFGTIMSYVLGSIWSLLLILPTLSVTVRRLHDNGYSGWWYFIILVPFIGIFWLLYLTLKKNNLRENQYGKPVHYLVLSEDEAKQLNVPHNEHQNETIVVIAIIVVCYVIAGLAASTSIFGASKSESVKSTIKPSMSSAIPTSTHVTSSNEKVQDNAEGTQLAAKPKQTVDPNVATVNDATSALYLYHEAITNKNIKAAYNMLTDHRKQVIGGFDSMRRGYATTIESVISYTEPTYVDPNKVVLRYRLDAKDLINGQIKLQTFSGTVTMVKIGTQWYMDDMTGRVVGI